MSFIKHAKKCNKKKKQTYKHHNIYTLHNLTYLQRNNANKARMSHLDISSNTLSAF